MKEFSRSILMWAALVAPTATSNLDFGSGITGQGPNAWRMSTVGGGGFRATLVNENCWHGRRCVMLSGPSAPADGSFGNLYEIVPAEQYTSRHARSSGIVRFASDADGSPAITGSRQSRHVRFRAAIRVEGGNTRARLWLAVDRRRGRSLHFSPDITATRWAYYQIEADVPLDSRQIVIGVLLSGSGNGWVEDAGFSVKEQAPQAPRRSPRGNSGVLQTS